MLESESPPSAKKLSSTERTSTCRTSDQISASRRSIAVAGARGTAVASGSAHGELRERVPVDLAVGTERQRREDDERRRDHGVRKALGEKPTERLDRHRACEIDRGDVRDQTRLGSAIGASDDGRLAHGGMLQQHRLDLPRLDPHPANLHLLIEPPEALERAVRQARGRDPPSGRAAPPAARRTDPATNAAAVRAGSCRYPRPTPTPLTQSSPTSPAATGARRRVEHVHRHVGDRPPDRHSHRRSPAGGVRTTWCVTSSAHSVGPYAFTSGISG